MLERILNGLTGTVPTAANDFCNYMKCESFNEFVVELARLFKDKEPICIVLDNVESMRDNTNSVSSSMALLLASFQRLGLLSDLNVCVVFVTNLVWERFRSKWTSVEPVLVHFSDYSKSCILDILIYNFEPCGQIDDELELYKTFVTLIYDVFHESCNKLNEIMYLVQLLYKIYRQPVLEKTVLSTETGKLYTRIHPFLKNALGKLYLREISSNEWNRIVTEHTENSAKTKNSLIKSSARKILTLV
jgi:origin recognition complex subunit 5